MLGDPTRAEGTNIDAGPKRRFAQRAPCEVRTDDGEGDDNEGVCHVERLRVPGKWEQYEDVSDRVQAERFTTSR